MKDKFFILLLIVFGVCFGFKKLNKPTPYRFETVKHFPKMPVSEINRTTNEGVNLGRFLFYDSILSIDYSMTCASCHQQNHAFSDAPNQFSVGVNGDSLSRNTMPLYNLAWYPSFFWDGKAKTIEEQVFFPVKSHLEMNLDWGVAENRIRKSTLYKPLFKLAFGNQKIDSNLIAKAIAQFERTLISSSSKFDDILNGNGYLTEDEYKGYGLVNDQTKGGCLHCHITDGNGLGTNQKFSNNGLDPYFEEEDYTDKGKAKITGLKSDIGKFKIPSLRNLSYTSPYMHDGRFTTLKQVLDFYSEGVNHSLNVDSKMEFSKQGGNHLSEIEKNNIILFLLTLNDSLFISDKKFSNPFFTKIDSATK